MVSQFAVQIFATRRIVNEWFTISINFYSRPFEEFRMENGRAAQAKQSQALCPQQKCGRREAEMRSPLVTKSRPNDRATFSAPRSTTSSCRIRGAFQLGIVAL